MDCINLDLSMEWITFCPWKYSDNNRPLLWLIFFTFYRQHLLLLDIGIDSHSISHYWQHIKHLPALKSIAQLNQEYYDKRTFQKKSSILYVSLFGSKRFYGIPMSFCLMFSFIICLSYQIHAYKLQVCKICILAKNLESYCNK